MAKKEAAKAIKQSVEERKEALAEMEAAAADLLTSNQNNANALDDFW